MSIVILPSLLASLHFYPHFVKTELPFTLIPDSVRDWLNKGSKKYEKLFLI
jgi:hypothetical protein